MVNVDKWYSVTKRYLLWPILIPILCLVLLDYVQVLSWFLRIWVCAYMVAWWLGAVAGVVAGMAARLDRDSHWTGFLDYRIAHLVPSVRWGYDFVFWALDSVTSVEEAQPAAAPDPGHPGNGAVHDSPQEVDLDD